MNQSYSKFEINSRVIFGKNVLKELIKILKNDFKFKRIGVVVDYNLYKNSKETKIFINKIKKGFFKPIIVYYKLKHEPTYEYLDKVKLKFKKEKISLIDCMIGIGGGSAIDLAKGISTLIKNHLPSKKYMGFPTNINKSIPLIAIPSTAGTGTELAYNAVFIDKKNNIKLGINTKNNYPLLAVLDPILLSTSPKQVLINSALGALIRSIETYVSPKANTISKMYSKISFDLIYNNLRKVVNNRKDFSSILNLQWGAYYSMAALSNSSSGPAGALGYYFSLNFSVPQGLGYSVSGINVINLNHKLGFFEYGDFYDLIEKNKTLKLSQDLKSKLFIRSLNRLFKMYNSFELKNINFNKKEEIKINEFYKIVEAAFQNNPIYFKEKDLTILTKSLFKK